jgi:hypothetical protein
MNAIRKITVHVPADLIEKAQRATGKGITETIRLGLQQLTAGRAAQELRALRGKIRLSIDVEELRRDRR